MARSRFLTASEKAKITRAHNKAWKEYDEATDEVDKDYFGFLESNIYPTRNAKIKKAEEVKDAIIAKALAEYEKVFEETMNWQDTHPEVVRLGAIRDAKHKEQSAVRDEKIAKVYKELGLKED